MGYGVVFGQMCWIYTLRKEMSLVLLRFYQVLENSNEEKVSFV